MQVELFFDYACPFCYSAHKLLVELIPDYPNVEIIWRPCEAHPQPESGRHSDLCVQGMLFAADTGADLWAYHARMYELALPHTDIEDVNFLADNLGDILDSEAFRLEVGGGKYHQACLDANDYAYEQSGVWYVPAYRTMFGGLDAAGGVGVTKEQLKNFLENANHA
jgi:predicted DsbA family dithiol-disulfide isomerase